MTQLIAALLLATLGAGCAGNANVAFDEHRDFSKYQSFSWLVRDDPNISVNYGSAEAVDAKLVQLIEQRLLANGFRRARVEPDFYITYQVALRRYQLIVNEPSATRELSSLHSSPSYIIEGSQMVPHRYLEMQLVIAAVRPSEGTLWSASFTQNEREHHAVKLEDAVAMLLERFPRRHSKQADGELVRASCPDATPGPAGLHDAAEETLGDDPEAGQTPADSCPEFAPKPESERSRPMSLPTIPT